MDRGARRSNGAWEIVLVRPGPGSARSDRCAKLLLLWSAAVAVTVAVYVFAGYIWGSVATAVLLTAGCWFTCYYFNAAPEEPPLTQLGVAVPVGDPQIPNGGGLSQEEIEAIPAFEYRKAAAAAAPGLEQCAVCINVVRDGETMRRLPTCGHAFHATCLDGWLRAHATCPMCRAGVKVTAEGPLPDESPV